MFFSRIRKYHFLLMLLLTKYMLHEIANKPDATISISFLQNNAAKNKITLAIKLITNYHLSIV